MSSEYKIAVKRLILVDSAGFAYTEIPLDDHAILLGTGNVGKSSILNSLRLFLLPEENFKRSDTKFGFRNPGKNEYYKNEESYTHYFPSARSFIILETENPSGTHCQILYRGDVNGLSYKRMFVPAPYSDLRDTFWDTQDEDGIGFAQSDLSVAKVTSRCKELSGKTQLVHDKRQLSNMLYAYDLLNKDRAMFTILPMADVNGQKIESIRTLIKMLFEVGSDPKSMAQAVANIIESQKNYERDRFDFNISDFLSDREKLDKVEQTLNQIKSAKPAYAALGVHFEDYKPQALAERFNLWSKSIQAALHNSNKDVTKLQGEFSGLDAKQKDLDSKFKAAGRIYHNEAGEIRLLEKQKSKFEKIIEKGKALVDQYPGMRVADIKDMIEEEREVLLREVKDLEEAHQKAEKRQALGREIEQKDRRIEILQNRLENSQWELSNQLGSHPSLVLNSINSKLMKANPDRELSSEEITTIANFSDLFDYEEDASLFNFFGAEVPENRIPDRSIEDEIKGHEIERRKMIDEKKRLEDAANDPEKRARAVRKANQEIKDYEKALETLKNFEGSENHLEGIEKDLVEAKETIAASKGKVDDLKANLEEVEGKLSEIKSRLDDAKAASGRFIGWARRLENIAEIQKKLVVSDKPLAAKEMIAVDDLTEEGVKDLEERCMQLRDVRENILDGLRFFFDKGILDEEHKNMILERPNHENIQRAWDALQDVYNNLDHRVTTLEEQRRTHNELVETYRTSLRKNRDFIRNVEGDLNRKLESVRINDLAEIRVKIECDPAFESLVEESENINIYTTESLSDAFYDKLKAFMSRFYDIDEEGNAEYRLTMERVIKRISYQTRKASQSSFDDKAQSNSTTSLINLALVQNLLKGLLADGFDYSLPAVLDEVASVDISQIRSLLSRIKEEGFRLFGAATHSASGALVLEIGRHFKLDEMQTARPFNEERPHVYWGGPEGVAAQNLEGWVSPEQATLLESSEG